MIKNILAAILLIPLFYNAQAPESYYQGTEGLSGYVLKSKLHDIIATKNYNYHYDDLKTLYGQTDIDKYYDYNADNTTYLLDIYSNNPNGSTAYHYTLNNIVSGAGAEGLGWNREHMMPQSSFNSAYPMYSDLFFVVPTDARINQLRSNYPYGKAGSTVYYTFTNGSKQASNGTPNSTYKGRVYEPVDEFKGDVARSLLYYAVRYEGKLGSFNFTTNAADPSKDENPLDGTEEKAYEDWYIAMLMSWNAQDPVSQREIDRNNAVYNLQKNRNPFIDHPEWVGLIWDQTLSTTAPSAPSQLKLERNSAYFINLSWQPSPDNSVIGYRIYLDGVLLGAAKNGFFTADHLTPNTTYNFTVKAYNNAYLESAQSNTVSITTLENDIFAKDLQITKYIEGSGNNKALEITNKTGHSVDLTRYKLSIQQKITNYFFAEPSELEGKIEDNKSFVVINPNSVLSCLNPADAAFVSNAPALNFTGSQYLELSYKSTTIDAIGAKGIDNNNANQSLYRKADIINPNSTFDSGEWLIYPSDYCLDLGVLSIDNIINKQAVFSIYPNPVTDKINIKGNSVNLRTAKIFDLSGKMVREFSNASNTENYLDVRTLIPGNYILSMDGKSVKFIKK